MPHPNLILATLVLAALGQAIPQASPSPATPQHKDNFEAEQRRADELFTARKLVESLPLYEDLCRQDPTIALFAERHGAALLAEEQSIAGISDARQTLTLHTQGISELKRAKSLGDNSEYIRITLALESRTLIGAVQSGAPLTVGYTYHGKPDAQPAFLAAEKSFKASDWAAAATLYIQAATTDPAWYDAALFAGDAYFRQHNEPDAAAWFAKAIVIDPYRETAYRYWGDALFHAGDCDGARLKFVEAAAAEPYDNLTFDELGNWARHTNHQLVVPAIVRPAFTTPNGVLQVDPALAASTTDGRSSWIVYQQYRVAHGARVLNQAIVGGGYDANAVVSPNGYRHTIAEEHAALRAMLTDIDKKLAQGTLTEATLDPSIRLIRTLEHSDVLGAWIAINCEDAGIRSDYPQYRAHHRKHLVDYINNYLIRETPLPSAGNKPVNGD